jgi:hypothetical protein
LVVNFLKVGRHYEVKEAQKIAPTACEEVSSENGPYLQPPAVEK